ncbi:hypothetical protein CBM2597_U10022 [Cupriavidus taiwanensis]|uniref:Uncharacterized protein n=1 Tax=Cupriavidus taiwanensis TaxID=164546 RepID=A0A7Z7JIJ1_9BURK|nr:hypothetical protein CBM2597_U10022 [Cupriavidus taiwanensis]SPC25527.1 hypothetical protein CBM2594_U10028 [Cupriavidus taiwanensis]
MEFGSPVKLTPLHLVSHRTGTAQRQPFWAFTASTPRDQQSLKPPFGFRHRENTYQHGFLVALQSAILVYQWLCLQNRQDDLMVFAKS